MLDILANLIIVVIALLALPLFIGIAGEVRNYLKNR